MSRRRKKRYKKRPLLAQTRRVEEVSQPGAIDALGELKKIGLFAGSIFIILLIMWLIWH